MSQHFLDIAHLRVNEEQPATSTSTGLDFERCSALHNAIVRYGWLTSGHDLSDLPEHTWWTSCEHDRELAEVEPHLHHSVISFLKRALDQSPFPDEPQHNNFFYCLGELARPFQLWETTGLVNSHHITLYLTHDGLGDTFDGIVYDLTTHLCVFNGRDTVDLYDREASPAWQPLETVLSVYIDMIVRRKAVALHKTVVRPNDVFFLHPENGRIVHADLHPAPPPRADPATGAKRSLHTYNPWTLVPCTTQDVEEALSAWDDLLDAIDERKPHSGATSLRPTQAIFTLEELKSTSLRVNGFAWNFFLRARRPPFTYVGPGLRLPTLEELGHTLFPLEDRYETDSAADSASILVPLVPVLIGSQTATPWLGPPYAQTPPIPWGLYLDACELDGPCLFEDGCRLVLPYSLGENGFARKADGSLLTAGVGDGHAELYQLGQNPFIPDHPSQLLSVLWQFSGHVRTGMWEVGADGVEGDADVFREADTAMVRWQDGEHVAYPGYRLIFGAGDRYW